MIRAILLFPMADCQVLFICHFYSNLGVRRPWDNLSCHLNHAKALLHQECNKQLVHMQPKGSEIKGVQYLKSKIKWHCYSSIVIHQIPGGITPLCHCMCIVYTKLLLHYKYYCAGHSMIKSWIIRAENSHTEYQPQVELFCWGWREGAGNTGSAVQAAQLLL